MSDDRDMPGDDALDRLAGEYALGLLEGDERAGAVRLLAADEDFRQRVARWSGRFAPLLGEVESASPPPDLWARVQRAITPGPLPVPVGAEGSNVVQLRRKVNLWRGYFAAATALAASLALFLVTRPDAPAPAPRPPEAPLVAMMSAEDSAAKLVATYDPVRESLIVTPSAGVEPSPGHAHELWLIPADGKPRSMGLFVAGGPRRMAVPAPMLAELKPDVTLALSVEPEGGSPSGSPTGPVIAAGKLARI
ncbi:MAG TPA: anti-sigma factor [Allosphingosinicella sp.]|jgi:anti-sigma-K factor RskA